MGSRAEKENSNSLTETSMTELSLEERRVETDKSATRAEPSSPEIGKMTEPWAKEI